MNSETTFEELSRALAELRAANKKLTEERNQAIATRDAAITDRELLLHPSRHSRSQVATKEDIYYCFRLLLGRDPNPDEWPGHSARAGHNLANVVSSYVTCREFAIRNLLGKSYTDAVRLVELPTFRLYAPKDDLAVGFHIETCNVYEPHVTTIFHQYVKPGMSVLDIGANIGYFTMLAASLVGPTGRVFAVEPNPANIKLLEASRRVNRFENVTIIQAAAGLTLGILALNVSHSNGMATEMYDDISLVLASQPVACVLLDDILPEGSVIDFIKIDVEGAEMNALIGLSDTIGRHRPIIVSEFGPGGLEAISGCTGIEYLEFLTDKGYELSVIGANGFEKKFGHDTAGVMVEYENAGGDHIDILANPV